MSFAQVVFPFLLLMLLATLVLTVTAGLSGSALRRIAAALMAAEAAILIALLAVDDGYRSDGTSNWSAYDVEYAAIPTAIGLAAAATWLWRRAPGRLAAGVAPLLTLAAAAASWGCIILTVN